MPPRAMTAAALQGSGGEWLRPAPTAQAALTAPRQRHCSPRRLLAAALPVVRCLRSWPGCPGGCPAGSEYAWGWTLRTTALVHPWTGCRENPPCTRKAPLPFCSFGVVCCKRASCPCRRQVPLPFCSGAAACCKREACPRSREAPQPLRSGAAARCRGASIPGGWKAASPPTHSGRASGHSTQRWARASPECRASPCPGAGWCWSRAGCAVTRGGPADPTSAPWAAGPPPVRWRGRGGCRRRGRWPHRRSPHLWWHRRRRRRPARPCCAWRPHRCSRQPPPQVYLAEKQGEPATLQPRCRCEIWEQPPRRGAQRGSAGCHMRCGSTVRASPTRAACPTATPGGEASPAAQTPAA
mmetsp:Transcript_17047/g.54597  ORF Transcript_17047/g.54597 Transcript_17047/m.54597 type:complete len:354 (-) Transcript_17047:9-1070(-)